jgi:hypothetical protein
MKVILILIGIILFVLTYSLYSQRCFNILYNIGSEGTLLECLIVFCPIVHIVFALKHRNLTYFKTFWDCIKSINFKKQYKTIKENIKKYEKTECPICRSDVKTGRKKEVVSSVNQIIRNDDDFLANQVYLLNMFSNNEIHQRNQINNNFENNNIRLSQQRINSNINNNSNNSRSCFLNFISNIFNMIRSCF